MLSLLKKRWVFADPDPATVERLAAGLKVSPLMATLLINRAITDEAEGRMFLDADLEGAHDPFLMRGMDKAVGRILEAIERDEGITIFGDYDVDGVTSTALMHHFFHDLGIRFDHYLPERMEEGYGVNDNALDEIKARGNKLVITADCGITAVKQVAYARTIGLDVIVTDHHQVPAEGLPDAVAVLNPFQPDCTYPFKFLSGVGIVFKLAVAVRRALHEAGWSADRLPNLKKHLDLFTLGTIADMAPLTGENHLLTHCGLEVLGTTEKPGLVALKSVAGIDGKVDASSIGFGLAPRLNAAGRLGKADSGLDLLVTHDQDEARRIAQKLDLINEQRKHTQQDVQNEAEYLIEREVDLERDKVLVLASENFHQGVIGIVASKLADKYYRPTFLIAIRDGMGKGSARSIPTFNLYKAMSQCADLFTQYGGHAYAAGLNIEAGRIDDFRKAINEVGAPYLTDDRMISEIKIDSTLDLKDISLEFYKAMQKLGPFGQVNTLPVFCSRRIRIRDFREIGRDRNHVRFRATHNKTSVDVVGFRLAETFRFLDPDTLIDIAYELNLNTWNGREKVELKLLDVMPSETSL
ncbi:single-stranded-DNA-specific exonuclease RecJ [Nitrospina watsonii]|uniref:Single-stranded-DNA-specific exonuclease RecJ n=1 Tax=Nitrospina watsonii TaxID=1323948 RepID=A0ABM9HFP8_9BACT|nr:single-stranded-DNA-specific exonuclease RecJ [Nitrospina watsonii]CAI2719054.1 Single-stranded-DNA-specific exonuclease recJ [Nitrospina watsonii]